MLMNKRGYRNVCGMLETSSYACLVSCTSYEKFVAAGGLYTAKFVRFYEVLRIELEKERLKRISEVSMYVEL